MKMIKIVFIILLLLLMVVLPLQGSQADVSQKRFEIDPAKQAVINYTGIDEDVFVDTHDKNEILFKFEKRLRGSKSRRNVEYLEKIQPEINFTDNTLTIDIKYPRRRFNIFRLFSGSRVEVTTTLLVPANTDLKIRVVDGDIDVSGLNGKVALRSVDGDFQVKGCEGQIKLHTVDGDIEVDRCIGSLNTKTTDGDVTATGIFSGISFTSVDGEGEFILKEGSVLKEDWGLRTVDGDIQLTFKNVPAFKLNAKTTDGSIAFDDMEFEHITLKKKNQFRGERGDAQYTIQIKTTDGDISLRNL